MGNISQGLILEKWAKRVNDSCLYRARTDVVVTEPSQVGYNLAPIKNMSKCWEERKDHDECGLVLSSKIHYCSKSTWSCHQADPCQRNTSNRNQEIHLGRVSLHVFWESSFLAELSTTCLASLASSVKWGHMKTVIFFPILRNLASDPRDINRRGIGGLLF